MSTPARPELRFSSFDEMLTDVDRLRTGPYEKSGQWDLPMILDHLAKTMNGPFDPAMMSMPWPASAVSRWFIHRIVKQNDYPSIKIPAIGRIRPQPDLDIAAAHTSLLQSIDRIKSLTGPTTKFPPFGIVPLEDFTGMQLLHGSHHLSFLKPRST